MTDVDLETSSDYGETIASEWTSIKTATLLHLHEHGRSVILTPCMPAMHYHA